VRNDRPVSDFEAPKLVSDNNPSLSEISSNISSIVFAAFVNVPDSMSSEALKRTLRGELSETYLASPQKAQSGAFVDLSSLAGLLN
jgi:hypothetical protein